MLISPPFIQAKLLRRYKRFLADVIMPNGEELTVHCPNTGSMKNCVVENSPCWLSKSNNPKRKYSYTWELATTPSGKLACINTHRANELVVEAIQGGFIAPLQDFDTLEKEKKYGEENSRIDVLLHNDVQKCFVEVKSVTLEESAGEGFFPDAVSERGSKHLRELMAVKAAGHRAVLLFCVQHEGINEVRPASHIDPRYSQTIMQAVEQGVEVYSYGVSISQHEIAINRELKFVV